MLEGRFFDYYGSKGHVSVDSFVAALPKSLQQLVFIDKGARSKGRVIQFHTSSLQHLSALEVALLPDHTCVTGSTHNSSGSSSSSGSAMHGHGTGSSPNSLAALTALTLLTCGTALRRDGCPLLAAPNLVELKAGAAMPQHLEGLADKKSLRYLSCILSPCCYTQQAAALTKLTQLTGLAVSCYDVDDDVLKMEAQWPPAFNEDHEDQELRGSDLMEAAEEEWGAALSGLTGLQKLRVEPKLFWEIDLGALTALTRIGVDYRSSGESWAAPQLLAELAPLRGRVQKVALLGLQEHQEEDCRAAVVAAVGEGVEVVFE
jgi:hypothetical protein